MASIERIIAWWSNITPAYTHKYIREYNIKVDEEGIHMEQLEELYNKVVYVKPEE